MKCPFCEMFVVCDGGYADRRFEVLAEHLIKAHVCDMTSKPKGDTDPVYHLQWEIDRSIMMTVLRECFPCPCGHSGKFADHLADICKDVPAKDQSAAIRRHFAAARLVQGV